MINKTGTKRAISVVKNNFLLYTANDEAKVTKRIYERAATVAKGEKGFLLLSDTRGEHEQFMLLSAVAAGVDIQKYLDRKLLKNELLGLTEAVRSLFGMVEATGEGATEPRLFAKQVEKHSEYISYAFIELFSLGERETLFLLEELKNIGGKCGIMIEVGTTTAIKPNGYVMMMT